MFSFSHSPIAFTANGVEAPAPKRSHVKFIAAASQALSLLVLNALLHSGFKSAAVFLVIPQSSATAASPIHTAYMQNSVSETSAAVRAPPIRELKKSCGATMAKIAAEHIKIAVNTAFIK